MPHITQLDAVINIGDRFGKIDTHGSVKAHVLKEFGNMGVASSLFEHVIAVQASALSSLNELERVLKYRVQINQVSIRQDQAVPEGFEPVFNQRTILLDRLM